MIRLAVFLALGVIGVSLAFALGVLYLFVRVLRFVLPGRHPLDAGEPEPYPRAPAGPTPPELPFF